MKILDFFGISGFRDFGISGVSKKGEANWTVAKLLQIILVVVVLIFLIFAVSNGIFPSLERVESGFNKVLSMLRFQSEIVVEDCYYQGVEDVAGGKGFLEMIGLSEGVVEFVSCPSGVCSFSGAGLEVYRVYEDDFQKGAGASWKSVDFVFEGDLSEVRRDFEVYHKGVDFFEGLNLKGVYDGGVSGRLILYGNGEGFGRGVYAVWENGKWMVVKDVDETSFFSGLFGSGREVYYEGSDTEEALDVFVSKVWSKGFFGNDDEVYWKVLGPQLEDDSYLSSSEHGQSIGGLIAASDSFDSTFDNRYNSIAAAEHGDNYDVDSNGFRKEYDPWTRTKAVGSGSSAYGPVQLTKGLAKGYLTNGRIVWSGEEKDYLNRFIEQGNLFLKWGGEDMPEGREDLKRYDYGGSGDLTSEEDKIMYRQVASKMLEEIYERHDKNEDEMWREWRFGDNNYGKEDKRYEEDFYVAWNMGLRKSGYVDEGDYDEVDTETDVENLKIEVGKIIAKLSWKSRLSDGDVEALKEVVDGKELDIYGEKVVLDVEDNGLFPVVGFELGGERLGFMMDGDAKVNSKFLDVKLRYFPIKLVRFDGRGWIDIGEEEYYRLYEKDFTGVYRASVAAGFLREKC